MEYNTDYIDSLFKDEFITLANRKYEYKLNVCIERCNNATVLPFVADLKTSSKGIGGVIDEEGGYIKHSASSQEDLMPIGYELNTVPIFYDETVIYLGYFIMQWGHFLVDFVPRMWWLKDNYNGEKILVLTSNKKARINDNYLELFKTFGITEDKLHYVYEPEKYKQIIVPEMSMIRPIYYSKESEELFAFITEKATMNNSYPKYEKIYFSRSRLKKAAMTEIGESDIENIFKHNGYKILYPEKCSFKELVCYINNCKEFASVSGTIPHNIIFAKPNTRVIILNKTYRINTIQLMLNIQARINPIYIDSNICLFPASPGSGPFWIEVENNFIRYAQDNKLNLPLVVTSQNRIIEYFRRQKKARRLQKYILMYARLRNKYLDIGGSILGAARPDENFANKHIYYFYREKVKGINTNTNLTSFLTNLYHYIKGID